MTPKEYYKSTRMVETKNWTLEMVFNFSKEYADQETERLKAELEEKNKEIQEWKKDLEVKYHEKHRDDEYYINKIKHLNSILKGKDSEIERLKDILKIGNKSEKIRKMQVEMNDMCLENDSLKNNISKLQSELTDLKERHKKDVVDFNYGFTISVIQSPMQDDGKACLLVSPSDYIRYKLTLKSND